MSDPENPLTRWSRRKSEARVSEREADGLSHDRDAEVPDSDSAPRGEVPSSSDLANLPPLDSISAGTDIRAFLGKGVPAELTVAALRRSWSADPAIRDFIGLSENTWDFHAAGGIPGFGCLTPQDLQQLLAQTVGLSEVSEEAAPARAAPSSSDPAATQATETASGSEQLQYPTANNLDQYVGRADFVRTSSSDGMAATMSTAEPANKRGDRLASQPRRHGSASPRFDRAPE